MRNFFSAVIRFFLTGIATLLPLAVTIFVVSWAVKLADAYVGPSSTFGRFLWQIVGPDYKYPGYLVAYLVVGLLTILLGFLVTRATVAKFRKEVDQVLARIPFFGKIYTTVGQVVDLFGQQESKTLERRFGGVAEIRMGNVRLLALLTSSERYIMQDGRKHVLVYVPFSPIPATGFNLFVPIEDVRRLDMPVEDLTKLLMSLGLLGPQILQKPLASAANGGSENERELAR